MQEINKMAILGAGAMGAFFASRFLDTSGFTTTVIARDQRYERLKKTAWWSTIKHMPFRSHTLTKTNRLPASLSWP